VKERDLIDFLILTDGAAAPSYSAAITPPAGTIYTAVLNTFTATTDVPSPVYTWSVGSGATIVSGQGTASVVVRFTATGSQLVSLVVTGGATASTTWSGTVAQWVPTLYSGLAQWLDGSDSSSITLDGSNNVSQWNDKSGNARHVLQANATQRPSYITAGINGLNCLNFDGSDDFLASSAFSLGSLSAFAVVTARWTTTETAAFFGQNYTTNKAFGRVGGAGFDYIANDIRSVTDGFSSTTTGPRAIGQQPAGLTTGQAVLISTRLGTTGTELRFNRSSIARVARNDPPSTVSQPVAIGRPSASAAFEFWNGRIAELIVFSRVVSDTERDTVESYMSARWGTP